MKDKHLPQDPNQSAPPPKPHKREKRRRRRPPLGFIFLLLLVIAVAVVVFLWKNGYIHFGKNWVKGEGDGGTQSVTSTVSNAESAASEVSDVVEIKVDNEKIYIDGAEIANTDELKTKITEIGDKKSYNFVHDGAIKSTYDEVKAVLNDLERALSLKINYNETSE